MREHDGFLRRLEETFSRVSQWVAERRREGEEAASQGERRRIEKVRRELAKARRALRDKRRADMARVRESLEDMRRDYDVPLPRTALSRAELEALRRHLRTMLRIIPDHANLDSPNWNEAHEEYERSWAEVERAYSEGEPASP